MYSRNSIHRGADVKNEFKMLHCVPPGLQTFLLGVLGKDSLGKLRSAFIDQAILQHCRPSAVLCPLLLALGVQLHHLYESRILIDVLWTLGVKVSYSEVFNFVKSAAVHNGTDIPGFQDSNHDLHLGGDNVDSRFAIKDGLGQMHWMGMLGSVVPAVIDTQRIRRRNNVTLAQLKVAGQVDYNAFTGRLGFGNMEFVDKQPKIEPASCTVSENLIPFTKTQIAICVTFDQMINFMLTSSHAVLDNQCQFVIRFTYLIPF